MAVNRYGKQITVPKVEKCPGCGQDVTLKASGQDSQPKILNLDGHEHICTESVHDYELRPVGQVATGSKIVEFELKNRQLTLKLEGGKTLKVYAQGEPLKVWMVTPDGIISD